MNTEWINSIQFIQLCSATRPTRDYRVPPVKTWFVEISAILLKFIDVVGFLFNAVEGGWDSFREVDWEMQHFLSESSNFWSND